MSPTQNEIQLDRRIRAQLMGRDEAALVEVSSHWGRLLYGIALRITGSGADAEECVNDALLDLWRTPPSDPGMPVVAYVSTLVRRRAVDRVRFNTAQCRCGGEYACALEELDECLADPEGQSDEDATAIRDALQAFLDGLEAQNRRIFLLRYYGAFSVREVARQCGIGERSVEMRLNRMRKRLRRVLTEHGIHI